MLAFTPTPLACLVGSMIKFTPGKKMQVVLPISTTCPLYRIEQIQMVEVVVVCLEQIAGGLPKQGSVCWAGNHRDKMLSS